MSWGSLDENGRPLSKDRGRCYVRWINKVKRYGYNYEYRIMNAADYGAYTSRKRFFGIFARKGLPIVFPEATHCKNGCKNLFTELQPWKPVRDVLDFSNEGKNIFEREKPLSEKTLERIYAGLIKFVAGGKDAFMIKYNSVNQKTGKYVPPSLDAPCPTVATQNRLALAQVTARDHHVFVSVQYGNGYNIEPNRPAPTITTKDKLSLVTTRFIANEYSGGGQISSIMDKMPPYLVTAEKGEVFIEVYSTDSPMTAKIKEFMALYGIVDIKMRMLKIPELKKIMGFPEDYVLVGTQADQKKFIGNAVEVTIARAWCEALCCELEKHLKK